HRIVHRVAGLGSLGRERYVSIGDWRGGRIAREAKALVPSACLWAQGGRGPREIFYQACLSRAVRCRDPFVQLRGHWIVRRLAPDCSRIELTSLPEQREEVRLLGAMGWETANLHLGSPLSIRAVLGDLKKRRRDWLHVAAKAMLRSTKDDWKDWQNARD